MKRGAPLIERWRSKISVNAESGCWEWTGTIDISGYGVIAVKSVGRKAHRIGWELLRGPIPDGLVTDHLCRTRCCVNPDHLELVTPRVNALRGVGPAAINAQKTQCKHGHPLSGDNLLIDKTGRRRCRECNRNKARKHYRKRPHPRYTLTPELVLELRRRAADGESISAIARSVQRNRTAVRDAINGKTYVWVDATYVREAL